MRKTWRMIWITAIASFACAGAVLVIARGTASALAQATDPPEPSGTPPATTTAPPAADAEVPEDERVGQPVAPTEELPPDLRESADNNISFPVDI
jgi:hypothetical protein